MEIDGDRLCDLHVWQVGPGHIAVMASVVSETPQAPAVYKQRLDGLAGLWHVTVEVNAVPVLNAEIALCSVCRAGGGIRRAIRRSPQRRDSQAPCRSGPRPSSMPRPSCRG